MKTLIWLGLLISVTTISSCASPNIGKEVNPNKAFCKKVLGECSGKVGELIITYSISKEGDEYEVKGEATYPKGTTMLWTTYSGATFKLYLIKDSIVVEEVPVAGGSGGLDTKITFKRKFKSNGFDCSNIGYYMNVKG